MLRRGAFVARVEANERLCRDHFRLRLGIEPSKGNLQPSFPATRAGQFIQLGCRAPDGGKPDSDLIGSERHWPTGQMPRLDQSQLCSAEAMLRRPFSLSGSAGRAVELVHRVVGSGTRWLAHLSIGDGVDLLGPFGNGFDLPPDRSVGLIVGGGVGLGPMLYLGETLQHAGWRAVAFVGAMSADLLAVEFDQHVKPRKDGLPTLSVRHFNRLGYPTVVSTDDGSLGLHGRVTDSLKLLLDSQSRLDASQSVVFTCGPTAMMRAVAELAATYGLPCQVCLEQAMACGMGACQSCVVRIRDDQSPQGTSAQGVPWRYRLSCTEGPVFPADTVVW